MRNPLTIQIESWLGGILVFGVSAFLVGMFWVSVKNMESDADILNFSSAKLTVVSPQEKVLIDEWLANNGISVKDVGYRYLIKKYPDKPWLDR